MKYQTFYVQEEFFKCLFMLSGCDEEWRFQGKSLPPHQYGEAGMQKHSSKGGHQKGPKTKCTHRRPSHFPLKEHLASELPSFTLQRVCRCLKSLKVWEELLATKDWVLRTSHWRRQSRRLSTNPEQWLSQIYTWKTSLEIKPKAGYLRNPSISVQMARVCEAVR